MKRKVWVSRQSVLSRPKSGICQMTKEHRIMKMKLILMLLAAAMFAVGNVTLGDIVTRSIQAEYDYG